MKEMINDSTVHRHSAETDPVAPGSAGGIDPGPIPGVDLSGDDCSGDIVLGGVVLWWDHPPAEPGATGVMAFSCFGF